MISKLVDKYDIIARYSPAVLSALPAIILSASFKKDAWFELFENVHICIAFEGISIPIIMTILLVYLQRGIAKHLFENRIFNSGKDFPTSTMVLLSDNFLSGEIKRKIRAKIKQDFNIELLNEKEEVKNLDEAKKTARDAVSLIRKQVKDGDKTLHYNICYGLIRNLIAGALFAIPVAVVNVVLFSTKSQLWLLVNMLLAVFFSFLLIFNKRILTDLANAYAECLLSEFLTIKGVNNE